MRYLKTLLTTVAVVALQACSSSEPGSSTSPENDAMNEFPEIDSVVMLEATVRTWSESEVFIDYTISNTGVFELLVFDVGSSTTTGIDDEGLITLFLAKRDTSDVDFESTPIIDGRNLSPDQTLAGTASRRIPISVDFNPSRESFDPDNDADPDKLRFCIGFGTTDDFIPLTLTTGGYLLYGDLDLQSLTCTLLERP